MKILYKIITLVLIPAFLCQGVVWTAPLAPSPQPLAIFIPEQYGRMEKSPVSRPTPRVGAPKSQVILIKDAHCNYEAQTNIIKILDVLIRDYKIDLVGVEGSSSYVNPSLVLESNPKEDLRKKVSDRYLRTGLLTASEALSINKGKEPGFTIFGVEDLRLYLKDFKAFRDTVGLNSYGKRFIDLVFGIINQLKGKIYSAELKGFEDIIKKYESNELTLSRLIKVLNYNYGISREYRNLKLVHKSIRREEKIDFKMAEKERLDLVRELEKSLPKEDLQELVKQSLLYKLGKIPAIEYYTYLEPLARTSFLTDYIRLVKLQNRIDENGLFRELDAHIEKIYIRLCQNKTALNLHQLDRNIKILNKLLTLEAAREDLTYYRENKSSFTPERLLQFIKIQAPINNINLPPELNEPSFIENARRAIMPAEEFYRFALERDRALVENLLQVMRKNKKDAAVLICGGFHAEGVKRLLQDRDISTLTITPSITKIQEDAHELYLNRMLDKRIDPEKMLSELGAETILPFLATGAEGRKVGLDIDLREALRGKGIVVEEAITPDEFQRILPLLQELYSKGGSLATAVQKAVDDYNRLPGVEKISLPKVEEKPLVGEWQFDLSPKAPSRFRDIGEIISDLEKYNVYWRGISQDAETKGLILRRIQNLKNLPPFIQQRLRKFGRIKAINVKGSYLWGPGIIEGIEDYNPKDLDIMVIVEGREIRSIDIKLTPGEIRELFPDQDWTSEVLEIKLIGIGNFTPRDTLINSPELNRAISARFSGITISGSTLFAEVPPLSLILEKIRDLITAARIEDGNAVDLYNTSISTINTIIAYFKTLEQPDISEENRKTINRLIGERLKRLAPYMLAKIRVIKRLVEVNLWFSFVAGSYPGFKDIFETESIYSLQKAEDAIRRLLTRGVSAEELLTEDSIFQIEYALLEAEENLKKAFEILHPPIATEAPRGPAHITYLGIPVESDYYPKGPEDMERNGKTTVKDIEGDLAGKTTPIKIEGTTATANVDIKLLRELHHTDESFLALLSRALAEARRYPGADLTNLHDTITIALLDRSRHLAENHLRDGFIGINRLAIDIYRQIQEERGDDAAYKFIQFLLEHELVHELTGKGEEIEKELMRRDAERFVSLFGEDIEFILSLLHPVPEFTEWVKFFSYKEITEKSFGVLSRAKYEEDLVGTLEKGDTTVQVAHLKAQDFKGQFNTRGEGLGIGHVLGDVALPIIGLTLQEFLNRELEKYGATAAVYNQGPGYYIIFRNITDPSIVNTILNNLVKKDSEFRKTVIERIKYRLAYVLPMEVYMSIRLALEDFTSDNFNLYGGVSERIPKGASTGDLDKAKKNADDIDTQAIEIAKYAQLTITDETKNRYIEILARAAEILSSGRKREEGREIDERFTDLLRAVRDVPASNIEQYDETKRHRVAVSREYILDREYISFHTPMARSYDPARAYEALFKEYEEALQRGDYDRISRAQREIAGRATSYPSTYARGIPLLLGNQRFRDTINYIIRNRPRNNLRLTFRIGGDEYGLLVWNAETEELRILRFDGNNIGATTFQWGREIGDKVIDEQLRIIHETEDASEIPRRMLEFFNNMGDRALLLTPEQYVDLRNKLTPDHFEIRDGAHYLVKIPDVTVEYPVTEQQLIHLLYYCRQQGIEPPEVKERTIIKDGVETTQRYIQYQSRPMVSIGELVVDTKLIPKDELNRDYSVIQGRADRSANRAKRRMKLCQAIYKGQINPRLAYIRTSPFTPEAIGSFSGYMQPAANSEIAGFIVRPSVLQAVAGEIKKLLSDNGIQDIEDREILDAISTGTEGTSRQNIMGLLGLAKARGLTPERVFNLAERIAGPIDRLLGSEASRKGGQVILAVLNSSLQKIPEAGIEERPLLELLQPDLLAERIIAEQNPVLASFLLELLKAQIRENPASVKQALRRIAKESQNSEIARLVKDYIMTPEGITKEGIKEILRESSIGRYLDDKAIDELSGNPEVKLEAYAEGDEIVREGDDPDNAYIIVSGELGVSTTALGDIATLGRNDLFGEMAVLTGQQRTATVKAKTGRVVLLRLSQKALEGLNAPLEESARKRLIDQIERLMPHSVITPISRDWKNLPLAELESLQWRMAKTVRPVLKRGEMPVRLSAWHTKLSKLAGEEAGEYDAYMKEIGRHLMQTGIPEEEVVRHLEQLDNLIQAQDIVSEEFAYIPINARHVLNTARNIIAILDNPGFQDRRAALEGQYGKEPLRPLFLFLALSHQVGYRMVEVGKPETYARYREFGARMISDTFGAVLGKAFGGDALANILNAVKLQGERKEGMLADNNPLLFLLTLAQQMDISARRLEEWQKSPFFIQILSQITINREYIAKKIDLENARRRYGEAHDEFLKIKGELRELIYRLSSQELEKLRSKRIVGDSEYRAIKRALQSVDLEGVDFFLGTAMIEDIKIGFDNEGKLLVKVYVADKAMEYGSFANTQFYVNLVVERMQRSVLNLVEGEIRVELTSSELRQDLGNFIERLPIAELHSHLNGAIEFNRQWQMLIERHYTGERVDWDNVKGKDINARLRQLYPDRDMDLNKIFETAMHARSFLMMLLLDKGELVSDKTSDLELLPLANKYIKDLDLYTMLRLYINMRNHFRSLVEYLPIEPGKLPEFVMHFAVGSAIGKAEDRQRELIYLENNAYHLAMSSYRANGYYYEYRINLGKTKAETREEVEAITRGIERAEREISKGLKEGDPGFEGRIVLSFGRVGNKPGEYAQQAREFVAMLKNKPELLERVVGIDVANQEEGTPPEAFEEAFRIIEAYNNTLPEDMQLQMTYHVGEGFTDVSLETSLRFIDGVINYGASRLGHAISLGVDPAHFTQEPRTELVSERIKTLNWLRGLSEKLKLEYFTTEYIDSELRQLRGETVSVSYTDTARSDIGRIQDYLLARVAERDIVIETNPTSNVAIVVRDMKKHPLRRFLDRGVKFTINTDDAGVFGTDLRREYLRAADAFGLTVQELWEIASEGFRAHMGRPLRYEKEIRRRLSAAEPVTAHMEGLPSPLSYALEFEFDWPVNLLSDEEVGSISDAESVRGQLGRNLYYRSATSSQRELIVKRIIQLSPVISFLRQGLMDEDIVNISVFGSYVFGHEDAPPNDLDIVVVVRGSRFEQKKFQPTDESLRAIGRKFREINVKIIGEDNLEKGTRPTGILRGGLRHPAETVIATDITSSYWRNIVIWGKDFQNPNIDRRNYISAIEELLQNAHKRLYPAKTGVVEDDRTRFGKIISRLYNACIFMKWLSPDLDLDIGKFFERYFLGITQRELEDLYWKVVMQFENRLRHEKEVQLAAGAHMESMQVPLNMRAEHYSDTLQLTDEQIEALEKSRRGETPAGYTPVTVAGRQFFVQSDILAIVEPALARALAHGDLKDLPKDRPFLVSSLTRSPRLFEDHVGNGFIGINEAFLEMYAEAAGDEKRFLDILLQLGLEHELMHELTGKGAEIETEQMVRDSKRIREELGYELPIFLKSLLDKGIIDLDFFNMASREVNFHKTGAPRIAAHRAQNEDIDYIIAALTGKDKTYDGFADGAEALPYLSSALDIIAAQLDRIAAAINSHPDKDNLPGNFTKDPKAAILKLLNRTGILIIQDLDFLIFNARDSYWLEYYSQLRNAICIPEGMFVELRDSPNLLAAFLMGILLDSVIGGRTALTDEVIQILDPEKGLADKISAMARENHVRADELARVVIDLVNRNDAPSAIIELENALKTKRIYPSTLLTVLEKSFAGMRPEYHSTFSFLLSGSEDLREAVYNLISDNIFNINLKSGYSPLIAAIQCLYAPIMLFGDKWISLMREAIKILSSENVQEMVNWVSDSLREFRNDPQRIKRYLSILLLELKPVQNFRDFIYGVLALPLVKEIYPPAEYMELVIQTISKVDGPHAEEIREALKMSARLDGYTGQEKLLEQYKPYFKYFGIGIGMIRDYFSSRKAPLIVKDRIVLDPKYPEGNLTTMAGYDTVDDFKHELLLLFNETDILEKSLPSEVGREMLGKSEIHISHIAISAHTLVFLVRVKIDKIVYPFVLKKTFDYFHVTVLSDTYNQSKKLREETPAARTLLVQQHGEWITPLSRDGRLLGYYRTEEYLPGFSISGLSELFDPASKEYRIGARLLVAAYYNLFINVAKARWFIGDASGDNVMLALIGDNELTGKVVDPLEGKSKEFQLPEDIRERFFKGWLKNQGFGDREIDEGIKLAQDGTFVLNGSHGQEVDNIIRAIQERLVATVLEDTTIPWVVPEIPLGLEAPIPGVDIAHTARTDAFPAALAPFEELEVSEELVYEDGTKARGVLSREDVARIKDSIQKDGVPLATNLGVIVKVMDDPALNKLLVENINSLLEKLPPKERREFLTALKTNSPKEGLVLAILNQSEHLGENCQRDGFVGVIRYLLLKLQKATDRPTIDALSNLLQVILYHELRHEARIFEGPDEEFRQNLVDIRLLEGKNIEILINLKLIKPDSKFKKITDTVNEIANRLGRYGVEMDDNQKEELKKALLSAYEGKTQFDLMAIMKMLAAKIAPEKIFQLTAEIAEPINRFLGPKEADKGGQMIAAVLKEILELIPPERRVEAETDEERLLRTIQSLAKEKGIDPNAMQSVFDLFRQGLEILALNPSYKLDSNYFVLISQIEKLTGVDDKKIIEVFSRRGLSKERAEPVANSPLAQDVQKLDLYIELSNMSIRSDLDLGLEQRRGLFHLDGLKAKVIRKDNGDIRFLSGVDAVNKDLAKAYKAVRDSPGGSIIDRQEKITLVIPEDELIANAEREGKIVRYNYRPGIQALLKTLANARNIHIVIRASPLGRQILEESGILNEQITVEDKEKKTLEDSMTDVALSGQQASTVFLLTPGEGEKNRDVIKKEGIKAFGLAPGSAFHIGLLFGVLYAQAKTEGEIKSALESLKVQNILRDNVDDILQQIKEKGFFTMNLISIEKTLEELQNRRIYVEVAA